MKYLPLIWASLFRSRLRTWLTLLSIATAFLLFGLLDSVRIAFNSAGNSVAGAKRLVVLSKISMTQFLPLALESRIAQVPGVGKLTHSTWFGGVYQDNRQFFPSFSVKRNFLELYPEYQVSEAERENWLATRDGALVGHALAERHGWKVGDVIPLQATIFPQKDGSNAWPLKLAGIFRVNDEKRRNEENSLWLHWEYFDEANQYLNGQVGIYVVELAPGADAATVARAIDQLSANSAHETKTQTEQAFNQEFVKQFADVGMIVSAIMAAVFFTLVILTGNTISQSVRERTPELAVMKTLGFTRHSLLWLLLAEALLLIGLGGLLGLGLANFSIEAISRASQGMVQMGQLQPRTWLTGLGLMLLIALVVGLLPALRGMRIRIVDALAGR
ncbi:hypothetical protein CO611_07060 [Lysobacteraceae bacterium NML03-0222]|nr:hypothetical protein CO611_07060 [Xanthomonadaceae bacterium NML03-0222]